VYAAVADLRAEGVTEAQATDDRLTALIEEASREIDRVTGWFFEPRFMRYRLSGRGTPSLQPPAPPITLDILAIDGTEQSLDEEVLVVVGAPVVVGDDGPRLTLLGGRTFTRGEANIEVGGRFGFTEDDGTPEGRTPLAIRRACMLMVLRGLPLLTSADSDDAKNRWRILEERTRDQSYKLDRQKGSGPITGDPEIDGILLRYRRPMALGGV